MRNIEEEISLCYDYYILTTENSDKKIVLTNDYVLLLKRIIHRLLDLQSIDVVKKNSIKRQYNDTLIEQHLDNTIALNNDYILLLKQMIDLQTKEIIEKVIIPTLNGAKTEGFEFRGILFLGLRVVRWKLLYGKF